MKNLFIIDGLAGTGKSDAVSYLNDKKNSFHAVIIKKYTTRPERKREKDGELNVDLQFVSDEQFEQIESSIGDMFISYEYGGKIKYRYGFSLYEIEKELSTCKNVFIIIRDVDIITKLVKRYDKVYNVIPIFIYTDMLLVQKRLKNEGYSEEDIADRLSRNEMVWNDYASQDVPIYKHTIINNSDPNCFHRLIRQLLTLYNEPIQGVLRLHNGECIHLGETIAGQYEVMRNFIKRKDYDKNIFIMIRYRNNNSILRPAIQTWVAEKGYNCIFADKNDLTHDVYNPIALSYVCKYGVAVFEEPEDCNAFSPNVAYELGCMQTQFKHCLIIKHSTLRKYNFFDILKDEGKEYNEVMDIKDILGEWLNELK
ncbi:MAG: hypothetical protein II896_00530 [Clostridia bacterium]|nr:hypothetical protein [Clostridia bacterium]